MVFSHLDSLVLRGVSVLGDGSAVSLRLGSYETKPQTAKATPFSMRHPSLGCQAVMPDTNGRTFPNANANGKCAAPWADRLSRAGVLGRRSPALSAGGTTIHGWSHAVGGPKFTTAVRLCPSWAKPAASVGDVFSGRSINLHDFAFSRIQRDEREPQESLAGNPGTATRTPPAASTRGVGGR
jgi:hypothetical protein